MLANILREARVKVTELARIARLNHKASSSGRVSPRRCSSRAFFGEGTNLGRIASQFLPPGFLVFERLEDLRRDGVLPVVRKFPHLFECVFE